MGHFREPPGRQGRDQDAVPCLGTGWGQGLFQIRFQGCTVADPVYFHQNLRVTIQQMGGDSKQRVLDMLRRGVDVRPVSVADKTRFERLLDRPAGYTLAQDPAPHTAWVNMYQRQDVSAVALFYLNATENGLPPLPPLAARTAALPGGG